MQCRSLAAQLGRHAQEFEAAGAEIILILGDDLQKARQYAQDLKLPFPVLADPKREIYHRYNLEKSFILIQRSAALVVDRDGIIRFLLAVTNPLTWLVEYEEIFQAVQLGY